jgi:hypothetical protein
MLGIAWLAGLLLGYAGFTRYALDNGLGWTVRDTLYRTLQLPILESGSVTGPATGMLEIARFLLPALTMFTAVQALLHLFSEQLQWLRLWTLRDHVIVCGLGSKGSRLAHELLSLGWRVVAIEREPAITRASELQRQGLILLTGDATARGVLARARLHRARHLICLLGEDRHNLQVAFLAYTMTHEGRQGTLTCIVHLASPDLASLLKRSELPAEAAVPFQVETFHPYARAAQLLLQEDPGWGQGANAATWPGHLLVIGLGRLGEQLVVEAARTWHGLAQSERLCITILDRDAEEKTAALVRRHPQLETVCRLNPLPVDLSSRRLLQDALARARLPVQIQRVYVCLSDPVLTLQVCWSLLQMPSYQAVPIRARLDASSGLSGLIENPMSVRRPAGRVIPFDLYQRTCSAELVVGGLHELLARGLHEHYLSGSGAAVTGAAWEQLPEEAKEDNRQQARRIQRLLTTAGYQINPAQDWDTGAGFVRAKDIQPLARSEHELWRQAKQAQGWRLGPLRDRKARTHPDLISWEQLPEEERAKNVAFIRQLPAILARLGFVIELADESVGLP